MAKSLRLHTLLAFGLGALGAACWPLARAQQATLLGCSVTDNGVTAAAHFRVWRGKEPISGAICGYDVAVAPGPYELVITLDGVLGAHEQRVPVQARAGQVTRGQAAFETGELLVELTRTGRRSAGLVLLRQGAKEVARLSAGVATRVGVGTYVVEIESRGQRKRDEGITISRGERRVLAVEFGQAESYGSAAAK